MKRLFTIITIAAILLIAGCSQNPTPPLSSEADISSVPVSPSVSASSEDSPSDETSKPEPSHTMPPEPQSSGAPDTAVPQEHEQPKEMAVSSSGIVDGVIADKYGKRGSQQINGAPTLSIPLSILDAPEGTVCYAIQMIDPDSKPLCGYEWVHWLAVNIEGSELTENASIDLSTDLIQGKNDFGTTGYGGPTPPDKPHTYVIAVYALDAKVDLQNGFSKEEFDTAISGHVVAEVEITGSYSN